MQKQIQHKTLFLTLLFLYPIVYQSIHILEHRSYFKFHEPRKHTEKTILSEEEYGCAVCEYEFVTFESTSINLYSFVSFSYVVLIVTGTISLRNGFDGNHIALRAPPIS